MNGLAFLKISYEEEEEKDIEDSIETDVSSSAVCQDIIQELIDCAMSIANCIELTLRMPSPKPHEPTEGILVVPLEDSEAKNDKQAVEISEAAILKFDEDISSVFKKLKASLIGEKSDCTETTDLLTRDDVEEIKEENTKEEDELGKEDKEKEVDEKKAENSDEDKLSEEDKKKTEEERWPHDMYNAKPSCEQEQMPKSKDEIMKRYGYDIRYDPNFEKMMEEHRREVENNPPIKKYWNAFGHCSGGGEQRNRPPPGKSADGNRDGGTKGVRRQTAESSTAGDAADVNKIRRRDNEKRRRMGGGRSEARGDQVNSREGAARSSRALRRPRGPVEGHGFNRQPRALLPLPPPVMPYFGRPLPPMRGGYPPFRSRNNPPHPMDANNRGWRCRPNGDISPNMIPINNNARRGGWRPSGRGPSPSARK